MPGSIVRAGIVPPECGNCGEPIQLEDDMLVDCNRRGVFVYHEMCFRRGATVRRTEKGEGDAA